MCHKKHKKRKSMKTWWLINEPRRRSSWPKCCPDIFPRTVPATRRALCDRWSPCSDSRLSSRALPARPSYRGIVRALPHICVLRPPVFAHESNAREGQFQLRAKLVFRQVTLDAKSLFAVCIEHQHGRCPQCVETMEVNGVLFDVGFERDEVVVNE